MNNIRNVLTIFILGVLLNSCALREDTLATSYQSEGQKIQKEAKEHDGIVEKSMNFGGRLVQMVGNLFK